MSISSSSAAPPSSALMMRSLLAVRYQLPRVTSFRQVFYVEYTGLRRRERLPAFEGRPCCMRSLPQCLHRLSRIPCRVRHGVLLPPVTHARACACRPCQYLRLYAANVAAAALFSSSTARWRQVACGSPGLRAWDIQLPEPRVW